MGASGETWNGLCRVPWLRAEAQAPNCGTWYGGGMWSDERTLQLNAWTPNEGRSPFRTERLVAEHGGEDLSVLYARWRRDGWRRRGESWGERREVKGQGSYTVICEGDDGWAHRPTRRHPALVARFVGYLVHGYTHRFELEGRPDLLDEHVDSACWTSSGDLAYSRLGVLHRLTLAELKAGGPGVVIDLEGLEAPERPAPPPEP